MISSFLRLSKLQKINFFEPWWKLLTKQKIVIFLLMLGEIIINSYKVYTPILISKAYEEADYNYLMLIFSVWIGVTFLEYLVRSFSSIFELRTFSSVKIEGHSFFLTVDPIYHAKRASGAILTKIVRATKGIEDILARMIFDIIPVIIATLTAVTTIVMFNFWTGLIVLSALFMIVVLNTICLTKIIMPLERRRIEQDDIARSIAFENLSQIHLIRATFATEDINKKYLRQEKKVMITEGLEFLNSEALYTLIKALYVLTVAGLAFWLLKMTSEGKTTSISALAILMTYMRGTTNIIKLGKPIRIVTKSIMRITDLFDFIKSFGKQSFPVLNESKESKVISSPYENYTQIKCQNLFFDYNQQAKIFDGNNLNLKVPIKEKNKLYGIIGPSGIGKSTLINIVGGQLKPTSGEVLIDGINIYNINDESRKQLIAMQGQVATNMRGSLKYNLLFGIENNSFKNDYLINILERVGLWHLFEHTGGLETFVGESGMTLSGGQRQRLNFANLYLRAKYYQPPVVLIDEPTSSLDEISEQAITNMIIEIAEKSVTLVIAHRLKTIESAVAILDFSMIEDNSTMKFIPISELAEKSDYYKELLKNGDNNIEEE